jgi:hypothetical protein
MSPVPDVIQGREAIRQLLKYFILNIVYFILFLFIISIFHKNRQSIVFFSILAILMISLFFHPKDIEFTVFVAVSSL